jgi:pyrimidine operon attenuation protein/uracil phosphoribosyltransferase
VLDAPAINRALHRIAHEIVERNPELGLVILAGIPSRGAAIAQRLAELIRSLGQGRSGRGAIDA